VEEADDERLLSAAPGTGYFNALEDSIQVIQAELFLVLSFTGVD